MRESAGAGDKMISRVRLFCIAICLFGVSACATQYTPSPSRPFDPIEEFSSSNSVSLINGQSSTEKHSVSPAFYANRHVWTDVAIEIATRELIARGLSVVDGSPKSLTMSVESARTKTGWIQIRSNIVMHVAAGNGYSATYTGLNNSTMAANVKRQLDGAMMRVVVEMLKDPAIVAYLTE